MGRFFNMDNKFFTFMSRVADICILNVLCLLCCIPIVTGGAAVTAMYYVTLKMVRNEEAYIVRSFFKSFKENLKQGTLIHIIALVVGVVLLLDLRISTAMSGTMGKVLNFIFIAFFIVYFVILIYVYPVLSKFYNSIRNTIINALLMSIRHLPYTVIMAVICVCPVLLFLYVPSYQVVSILIMLFILMGFGTIAYLNSFFLVKIFDNYIPEEDKETDLDEMAPILTEMDKSTESEGSHE